MHVLVLYVLRLKADYLSIRNTKVQNCLLKDTLLKCTITYYTWNDLIEGVFICF